MANKDPTTLSLAIGKNDTDIMNWFNMIQHSGQSRSRWVGALLLAYVQGEVVPTGNCLKTSLESLPKPAVKQVASTAPFQLKQSAKKSYGWSHRDVNGDFTVGSSVAIKLSNKKMITALKTVKAGEIPVSYVVRAMIRRGFSGVDRDIMPDSSNIEKYYHRGEFEHYEALMDAQLNGGGILIMPQTRTGEEVSDNPSSIASALPEKSQTLAQKIESVKRTVQEGLPDDAPSDEDEDTQEDYNPFLNFI